MTLLIGKAQMHEEMMWQLLYLGYDELNDTFKFMPLPDGQTNVLQKDNYKPDDIESVEPTPRQPSQVLKQKCLVKQHLLTLVNTQTNCDLLPK